MELDYLCEQLSRYYDLYVNEQYKDIKKNLFVIIQTYFLLIQKIIDDERSLVDG